MEKIELLAPAKDLHKAKIAILYGADAVYVGGKQFSLRSRASNFEISDMEELVKLPGVGRKTANVVLSNAFDIPGLAVDTHVFRVSHRLGLADAKDPDGTEQQLCALIPREKWGKAHHWLIYHGRQVCSARAPKCEECFLADLCPFLQEKKEK